MVERLEIVSAGRLLLEDRGFPLLARQVGEAVQDLFGLREHEPLGPVTLTRAITPRHPLTSPPRHHHGGPSSRHLHQGKGLESKPVVIWIVTLRAEC